MTKIRVVLIEDHDLTRMGLRTSIQRSADLEFLGEAANGRDGLQLLEQQQPDVAIVDIGLPDIDGIEITKRIKEHNQIKILILTLQDHAEAVLAAFAAGADSYCMKNISFGLLIEAIKSTHEGNSWIDPAIAKIVLAQMDQNPRNSPLIANKASKAIINTINPEYEQLLENSPLTDRELEVLQLIVDGCSNAQIAEKLYITVGTVKTHVRNILNKLCADDRTQAAVRALRSGLVG